jgi:hypothetical protein
MYCPQCRVEYREGFTECADCKSPLLAGPPQPDPPDPFDPSIELTVVLESNEPVQVAMAKGLLEDAGIPFFLLQGITTLVNDVTPFLGKLVQVQVPRDREAEARELLASLLEPASIAETEFAELPGESGESGGSGAEPQ